MNGVRDRRNHFGCHQVIHQRQPGLGVRCILGNDHGVKPDQRALLRYPVTELERFVRRLGLPGCDGHVAVPRHRHAGIAVGQVADVQVIVEVADVRPDLRQLLFGQFQVIEVLAVDVQAHVLHDRGKHLVRVVEQTDPAIGKFRHHGRVEQHRPAVPWRIGQTLFDRLFLIADPGSAPGVDPGITIARIERRHVLAELFADASKVRQPLQVQCLNRPALDRPGQVLPRRQHQVITAAAGQQFGLGSFKGVEVIDHHMDAGFLLEIGQGIRGQVFAPDVQVHHRFRGVGGLHTHGCKHQQ